MHDDSDNGYVYVANLGKYNEGYLVGTFLHLPMPEAEIERKLHDEALIGTRDCFGVPYEEYAIHDYESVGWVSACNYHISEYDCVTQLNAVYALYETCDRTDIDHALEAWDEQIGFLNRGRDELLTIANLLVNEHDIPYYEGEDAREFGIEDLKSRVLSIAIPGSWGDVESIVDSIADYIDFDEYCENDDIYFTKYGALYTWATDDVRTDMTWEEIYREVERRFGEGYMGLKEEE